MKDRNRYRCRQCLGTSPEHSSAFGVHHKMDCSYAYEVRKLLDRLQRASEQGKIDPNAEQELNKYLTTRW